MGPERRGVQRLMRELGLSSAPSLCLRVGDFHVCSLASRPVSGDSCGLKSHLQYSIQLTTAAASLLTGDAPHPSESGSVLCDPLLRAL